jgi:hypothetical protein
VYHRRKRLSGSARLLHFGSHFFHLDFILAQHETLFVLGSDSGFEAKIACLEVTASSQRQKYFFNTP